MENLLNDEMELLISQLKKLNEQFSESIDKDQNFDNSKKIYLQIKAANEKLSRYFDADKRDGVFENDNTGNHH